MKSLAPLLLIAALTVPGAAAARSGEPCFRLSQMHNHKAVGGSTLYAKVGRRDVWRIDMKNDCLTGVQSDSLIVAPTASRDLICRPLDVDIRARSGSAVSACIIDRITRLTPAEIAALPKSSRP